MTARVSRWVMQALRVQRTSGTSSIRAAARLVSTTSVSLSDAQSEEQAVSPTGHVKPYIAGQTRRCGLLARKVGMTQLFTEWGERVPVTAFQVENMQVLAQRTPEKHGYTALQVGAEDVAPRKVTKQQLTVFENLGIKPKRHICEFKVSDDCLLPVGTELTCEHFIPGQYVDIQGVTIGKGFQGVMKRHNFGGMPASHGVTLTHRKAGGMGGGQDPGRVWKGKRMEGRMGGKKVTQMNLQVYRVDTRYNMLFVVGSVPGSKNSIVKIKDAMTKPPSEAPIPTQPAHSLPKMPFTVSGAAQDPFAKAG
eukprot:m.8625 g.8625  ORF g.8625 m.8625 type:complete len:307 (-) comp5379_c0_seq1:266-1186(-)